MSEMVRLAVTMWGAVFLGVFLRACTIPWQSAPVPVGHVVGTVEPWGAGTPIAGRHIVLCRAVGDPRQGQCLLMSRAAVTDEAGRFDLGEVPEGTYFLLYDSGLSDFDQAVERWGGQTLHFGQTEWFSEFLGVDLSQERPAFRLPDGLAVTPHEGWLQSYCTLTLLVGRSPFIIAHDIQRAAEKMELDCQVFNVVENVTRDLSVQVTYFGDE
jgi:hypothetical protein